MSNPFKVAKYAVGVMLAVVAIVGLRQFKTRQTFIDAPIGVSWKWGTSDPALQKAIETHDTAEIKRLLASLPRSAVRANALELVIHEPESLKVFLECGWDANGERNDGAPVYRAVLAEEPIALRILLEHGARANVSGIDPNWSGSGARSTIQIAAGSRNRSYELCKALLDHGANPNADDKLHSDPFDTALANLDLTRLFLDHGIDINRQPYLIRLTGVHHDSAHNSDFKLHDPVSVASLLVERGAKVDAEGRGFVEVPRGGGVIDQVAEQGTPLYFHALAGNVECVKLLLAHGANPLHKGESGRTPLDVATGECWKVIAATRRTR